MRMLLGWATVSLVCLYGQSADRRAGPQTSPVLIVGDEQITEADLKLLLELFPVGQVNATQEGYRKTLDQIIRLKAMAQEAKRRSLDRDPLTQQKLLFQADQVLANAELDLLIKSGAVSEEMMRSYYYAHKSEFEIVEVLHILLRFRGSVIPLRPDRSELSEEQASAAALLLREKIAAGADFKETATIESDDISTRDVGGDLGILARGRMSPEFDQAAFTLATRELSQPIRTRYGYHIIKVTKHAVRSFEDVRDQIHTRLETERIKILSAEVLKRTKVVEDERYLRTLT